MGGVVLGGTLMIDSLVIEPRSIEVKEVRIPLNGLAQEFDGFTICQITDVHHSALVSRAYVKRVVEMAGRLRPDLVVLTGDYIDEGREYMAPVMDTLSELKGRFPTAAVLGNHDYFIDWKYSAEIIRFKGINLLLNTHIVLESEGAKLCIAGVKDYLEDRPDVRAAFSGAPEDATRILLCHHPDFAEYLPPDERVDLVLSGHTHGGQVRIPFTGYAPMVPSSFGQKYSGGIVRLDRNGGPDGTSGTVVYVSRGVGTALLPVRFNCSPELTLIRLESV